MQGGPSWEQVASFYKNVYHCSTARESTERTLSAIRQVPQDHFPVLVAHSGPSGLGTAPQDICGVDFHLDQSTGQPTGGDWGDVDLCDALQADDGRCACVVACTLFCFCCICLNLGHTVLMLGLREGGSFLPSCQGPQEYFSSETPERAQMRGGSNTRGK
jgi:hypothetical protein